MAIKIEMPKLSDTMEEGVIAKWNIKEGDSVSAGDIIAEVETDKATMEVEAFDEGTVLKIFVKEGDAIPLGGLMAVIGEEGENIDELIAETDGAPAEESEDSSDSEKEKKAADDSSESENEKSDKKAEPEEAVSEKSSSDDNGRIKASPLAKKMAEDKGIDLSDVDGSGPEGRIVKKDIENYTPSASAPSATFASEESEDIRISQMRKTIARRLSESKFTSPHFYVTVDIDMEAAMEARKGINEISDVKISFNDIIVKACSVALRRHPSINASWMDDVIRQHGDVNIAIAVAVEDGLMTPVIRHTDKKSLRQISSETRELAGLSRDRKLQPEQMQDSTFTISNLGMFGIEEFTAIINPPNASILAVGAIRDEAVVKNGEVVPGKRMKVTLSNDHRVVDGASAAEFLSTVRALLENPLAMLL